MEVKAIEKQIDKLLTQLESEEVTSEEFDEIASRIRNLNDMRLRELELQQKVDETQIRNKMSRRSDIWGFLGKCASGAVAILGILLLGDIKEDQGMVDKDKFAIVRGMFPKG